MAEYQDGKVCMRDNETQSGSWAFLGDYGTKKERRTSIEHINSRIEVLRRGEERREKADDF
jgi:hypothetical protein